MTGDLAVSKDDGFGSNWPGLARSCNWCYWVGSENRALARGLESEGIGEGGALVPYASN